MAAAQDRSRKRAQEKSWDFWIDRGGTFTDVTSKASRTLRYRCTTSSPLAVRLTVFSLPRRPEVNSLWPSSFLSE